MKHRFDVDDDDDGKVAQAEALPGLPRIRSLGQQAQRIASAAYDADHDGAVERSKGGFPLDDSLTVIAEPGDLVFFSSLTVHGSRSNRSPRPRKSVIPQLSSGQDRTVSDGHPDAALVLRGWNHRMRMDRDRANAG